MRICVLNLIAMAVLASGCGSGQPTGSLESCEGTRSFQEASSDGFVLNFTSGWRVGQYIDVPAGTVANAFMVRASATGVSSMKIGIYYGQPSDVTGSSDQLIKEFTVSQTLNTSGTQDIWLTLPEPFTFPKIEPPSEGVAIAYYIVFTQADGTFGVPMNYVGNSSTLRKGFRYGGSIQWVNSYTDQGIGIGYRTNSDCISK